MSTDLSHVYAPDHVPPVPGSVRAARVLLLVGAAVTVVTVLAFVTTAGPSPESVGRGVWVCVPAVLALVAALRLARPRRWPVRVAVVACGLWVLGALASLGAGDPRGLTQVLLPVAVLVLLTRPGARAFLGRA